jgi:hypothetical protein
MPDWVIYALFAVGLMSIIGSFWTISSSGSSADAYAELSSTITGIILMNLVFTLFITTGLILYQVRKGNTQIVQFVLSGITLFLSITAVSIAVLQK